MKSEHVACLRKEAGLKTGIDLKTPRAFALVLFCVFLWELSPAYFMLFHPTKMSLRHAKEEKTGSAICDFLGTQVSLCEPNC